MCTMCASTTTYRYNHHHHCLCSRSDHCCHRSVSVCQKAPQGKAYYPAKATPWRGRSAGERVTHHSSPLGVAAELLPSASPVCHWNTAHYFSTTLTINTTSLANARIPAEPFISQNNSHYAQTQPTEVCGRTHIWITSVWIVTYSNWFRHDGRKRFGQTDWKGAFLLLAPTLTRSCVAASW